MGNEPVSVGNAIGALIPLVGGAGIAFNWWNVSDGQMGALTALYAGVLLVITAITRSKVTPTA